jgi:hypothetical protein
MRLPNLNDWSSEQEEIWRQKDTVEIERYYLNTHSNIKKMKKSPRGKPTCLIKKKKEWRNGLANILVNTVDGWKPIHRLPDPKVTSRTAPASVQTVPGIRCSKKETTTTTGMLTPTPKVPSFQISSSFDDEEQEEKDELLLND